MTTPARSGWAALSLMGGLFAAGVSLALAACWHGVSAPPVSGATLIQVTIDTDRVTATPPGAPAEAPTSHYCHGKPEYCSMTHVRDIRDPAEIAAVLAFVNARLDGWTEGGIGGLPIPYVELRILDQDRLLTAFASGTSFFNRGAFPATRTKSASRRELDEFHRLIGVVPPTP